VSILLGLRAKLAALGAALLAVLFFFLRMQSLKNQRDRAREERDVLKARSHVARVQKKIKREEEKRLVSRKADLVKELEKEGDDFKGVDNLTDSNDF
jgi:C4-dicarboxylate-specific signal transduction histidine kinase